MGLTARLWQALAGSFRSPYLCQVKKPTLSGKTNLKQHFLIPGLFQQLGFSFYLFLYHGGGSSLLPQTSSEKLLKSSKIAKIFQKCCTHYRHLGKLQCSDLAKAQQGERSWRGEVVGQFLILGSAVHAEASQCCPFRAECSDLECMLVGKKSY